MNTVYLVTLGPYFDDVLEDFATDEEDIKLIIKSQYFGPSEIDVKVNLDTMRAIVTNTGAEYYIHTVNRIQR
jgi:hypothetical protein